MASIKQNIYNIHHVSKKLKSNRGFVLELVKYNGDLLQYASEELQNDGELKCISKRKTYELVKAAR
jgi:hypothetical protein